MDTNNNGLGFAPVAELNRLPQAPGVSLVPAAVPDNLAPTDTTPQVVTTVAGQQAAASTDSNTERADKPAYEVGYKRPPRHSRFKPGQSGNPKGRHPKLLNVKKEIELDFLSKVPVRVGSKTVHTSKIALLVSQMATKGIKGDTRAAMAAFKIADQLGVLNARDEYHFIQSLFADLTPEEREVYGRWSAISDKYRILERYLDGARQAGLDPNAELKGRR
jgi:hypothetical protein